MSPAAVVPEPAEPAAAGEAGRARGIHRATGRAGPVALAAAAGALIGAVT